MTTVKTAGSHGLFHQPLHPGFRHSDNFDNGIRVRAFGTRRDDLDVDFDRFPRPVLITQLLQACVQQIHGAEVPAEDVWQWSLKQRLQALLSIVVATRGPRISAAAVCEQPGCGKSMELDLNLLDFRDTHPEDVISCRPDGDTQIQLRLPTGQDQLNWLRIDARQEGVAFTHMATSLVLQVNGKKPDANWRVPDHWLDNLADALAQRDALMILQLHANCPACRKDLSIDFDLETHLLSVLTARQTDLLHQIHRLASAYHWTESDIVALSTKRRNYYLGQLDGGSPE